MPTPSTDGSSAAAFISSLASSSSPTASGPKPNQYGGYDIYGIGDNSGYRFPDATGHNPSPTDDPVNGPGGVDKKNASGDFLHRSTPEEYLRAMMKLSQTDPSKFAEIQQGLYAAGYYGSATPAEIGLGRWNQRTKDALVGADGALTNFIEVSKAGGTVDVFGEWLQKQSKLAADDPNSPGNQASKAPYKPPLTLTDPSTLDAASDQAASGLLGHSLDASQQGKFVSEFQNNEQQQYDAQGPTGTGVATNNQNPDALAREFVARNNLPEYAQHQALGYMNVFANMFLHGDSSRAQTGIGNIAVGTTH